MIRTIGVKELREMMRDGRLRLIAGVVLALLLVSLAPCTVSRAAAQEPPPDSTVVELPELLITSGRSAEGYVERHSDVGLGYPAELKRVPHSVHVIARRMLEEQLPVTVSDVVRNTGGVSAPRNSVEPFRSFKLRGFNVGETFTDGIRNTGSLNIQAEGMANIERVEILRGPGGAVFGLGSPGGVVNIVTKKPLPVVQQSLAVRVGNFGYVQPEVDLTGPLAGGGALRYRLVATYERRNSFIDFVSPRNFQIAPSLEWAVRDGVTLRYQLDWRRRELLRYISHPFEGTVSGTDRYQLPRSLFTGEPDQGLTENSGLQQTLVLERSEEGVSADRIYFRFTNNRYDQPSVAPASLQEDGRTLDRRFNRFDEKEWELAGGARIVRRARLGPSVHLLTAGIDVATWTYDSRLYRGSVAPLDVVAPVYGAAPSDIFLLADSRDRFLQAGLHLQDAISIGRAWTVLVGGRVDRVTIRTEDRAAGTTTESTHSELSPRVGVSWEAVPGLVPFGSYSRSFLASPSFGSVAPSDGAPFEPEQGRQWEAGVKVDWGGTIMTTLAAYDLERSNVPVADPEDPAFRIVTGLQRSRGVELLGSWEPSPHFAVFGSYAYTDARLVRDTSLPEGTRLDNVPYHSGRVWLRGSIEVGEGHTVGAQLGSTFSDDVAASLTSDVTVPGYTVLDGGAFFESGAFLLQLAVQNVADRYYFLRAAFGGGGVVPGDARRIIGVARWRR